MRRTWEWQHLKGSRGRVNGAERVKGGGNSKQCPMMEATREERFPGAERAGKTQASSGLGAEKGARGGPGIEAGCLAIRQTETRHGLTHKEQSSRGGEPSAASVPPSGKQWPGWHNSGSTEPGEAK